LISNATPIICLSKINQLTLLKKLFKVVIIPSSVKKEILVEGKEGYSVILSALKEGWIKVVNPKSRVEHGIGAGENAAINLARERKDTIILDDAFAIKVAKAFNIPFIRTTTLLFMALSRRIISKDDAVRLLNKLVEIGYYISPREYSVLLTRLKQ